MLQNLYHSIGSAGYLLLGASDGAGGAAGGGGAFGSLLPFALIFLVMYLLIIRPQSKKQKAHKDMIANVGKGAKIVTAGGIHGTVVQVNEKTLLVKVDDSTKIEFNKESVSSVLKEAKSDAPTDDKATPAGSSDAPKAKKTKFSKAKNSDASKAEKK